MFCLTQGKKIVPVTLSNIRLNGFIKYHNIEYPFRPVPIKSSLYISIHNISHDYLEKEEDKTDEEKADRRVFSSVYSDDEDAEFQHVFVRNSQKTIKYIPPSYVIDVYYDGYFGCKYHINDASLSYIHGLIVSPFIPANFKIEYIKQAFLKYSDYRNMIINMLIKHANAWNYQLLIELIYCLLITSKDVVHKTTIMNYFINILDAIRDKDKKFFDIYRQILTRYLTERALFFINKYLHIKNRLSNKTTLAELFRCDRDDPMFEYIGKASSVYRLPPARAHEFLSIIHYISGVFHLKTYDLIDEIKKELMKMKSLSEYTNEYIILG